MTLYPDQQKAIDHLRVLLANGERRILLQAPTGWGKGTLATFMIRGAMGNGRRVLFLVNRRELVRDLSRRLDALKLDHGVIMANHPRRKPWLSVHIASVDTLRNREKPPADLLFADEAHFAISDGWIQTLDHYRDAVLIGMTATPIRLDGRGLGHVFTSMVQGPPMRDLIEMGRLAKPRVFAPATPDLSGVQKSHGDFNKKQLSIAMDRPKLVGDIVEHWLRLGRGRPTVAFCVDVTHSRHLCEQFLAAGVPARHVDANTPDDERDAAWAALSDRSLSIVSSVGIVSYGWDCPPVSCAILARPTSSLALYLQQVGRILRAAPGKQEALILDHAGNALRHGLPDEDRVWTLSGGGSTIAEETDRVASIIVCAKCFFTYRSTQAACPSCGAEKPRSSREPEVIAGELAELAREESAKCLRCSWRGKVKSGVDITRVACSSCGFMTVVHAWSHDNGATKEQERLTFLTLERTRRERGYKPGWSKLRFHLQFGYWPPRAWADEAERSAALEDAFA
jgi:superfamily II DNA or RNA helicase